MAGIIPIADADLTLTILGSFSKEAKTECLQCHWCPLVRQQCSWKLLVRSIDTERPLLTQKSLNRITGAVPPNGHILLQASGWHFQRKLDILQICIGLWWVLEMPHNLSCYNCAEKADLHAQPAEVCMLCSQSLATLYHPVLFFTFLALSLKITCTHCLSTSQIPNASSKSDLAVKLYVNHKTNWHATLHVLH